MTHAAEKLVARAEFLTRFFAGLAEDPPKGTEKHVAFCAEVFADLARTKRELGTTAAIERLRRIRPIEENVRGVIKGFVEAMRLLIPEEPEENETEAVVMARSLIDTYGE